MKFHNSCSVLCLVAWTVFACSMDDDVDLPDGDAGIGTPATEHHENDKIKDNGDGSSAVTMANLTFQTNQRDFSGEAVVTEVKTISAQKTEEYIIGRDIKRFKIADSYLAGFEAIDAFTSKILLYDLSADDVSDEHEPDFYLAGFDYNGIIMTVEGAEDVNFYKIENGKVAQHFFQIKQFYGSKFLSDCYLDHHQAYVYNSDELLVFPLDDTSNISKLMDVPSFSQVRMTSDSDYLYVAIADAISGSTIRIYNKQTNVVDMEIAVNDATITGIIVDANYLYYATGDDDQVRVINKHTASDAGRVDISKPVAVDKIGDDLYIFSSDSQALTKYRVSFQ